MIVKRMAVFFVRFALVLSLARAMEETKSSDKDGQSINDGGTVDELEFAIEGIDVNKCEELCMSYLCDGDTTTVCATDEDCGEGGKCLSNLPHMDQSSTQWAFYNCFGAIDFKVDPRGLQIDKVIPLSNEWMKETGNEDWYLQKKTEIVHQIAEYAHTHPRSQEDGVKSNSPLDDKQQNRLAENLYYFRIRNQGKTIADGDRHFSLLIVEDLDDEEKPIPGSAEVYMTASGEKSKDANGHDGEDPAIIEADFYGNDDMPVTKGTCSEDKLLLALACAEYYTRRHTRHLSSDDHMKNTMRYSIVSGAKPCRASEKLMQKCHFQNDIGYISVFDTVTEFKNGMKDIKLEIGEKNFFDLDELSFLGLIYRWGKDGNPRKEIFKKELSHYDRSLLLDNS